MKDECWVYFDFWAVWSILFFCKNEKFFGQKSMYLFRTLDTTHPGIACFETFLDVCSKNGWMVVFTKEFGTLDPHLPIVWDKVPKKRFFTPSLICTLWQFRRRNRMICSKLILILFSGQLCTPSPFYLISREKARIWRRPRIASWPLSKPPATPIITANANSLELNRTGECQLC